MKLDWPEAVVINNAQSPYCRLRTVPIGSVKMGDGFWSARMTTNKNASIPRLFDLLVEHGVIDNFMRVSGRKKVDRRGPLYTDSDLYKWLEAAAWVLSSEENSGLKRILDETIDKVITAQGQDGYLNTYYVDKQQGERFKHLEGSHELYCAGHLIQAAIAYFRTTGDNKFLNCANRFADYLVSIFGPGKLAKTDGHPEIEMALVELYRTTGKNDYLNLAKFFLYQPQGPYSGGMPLVSMKEIAGHAVRVAYLFNGAADYYMESGDKTILKVLEQLWEDMTSGKIYITGGIGSRYDLEAFGELYELPNLRAYAETCAAIANIFWNWRMLLITGEARFADLLETGLYNGFLSGVSLDGKNYFYVNPLASSGNHIRKAWYDCTCCPPNVQRLIASIPGYFFTTSPEGIWIHLYDNCRLTTKLTDGSKLSLEMDTRYPAEGSIDITVSPETPAKFSLFLRIPGWCEKAKILVNKKEHPEKPRPGTYLTINRKWQKNDRLHIEFAMRAVLIESHPRVRENTNAVAVKRGPLVYCFENTDNQRIFIPDMELLVDGSVPERTFRPKFQPNLLGGLTTLHGKALVPGQLKTRMPLYRPLRKYRSIPMKEVSVTAIPYYAWANRGASQMQVWLPYSQYNKKKK